MIEVRIDKLPGGDASRRRPLARVCLTNTGQGVGDVRIYSVRIEGEVRDPSAGVPRGSEVRTFRGAGEDVVALVHRALGQILEQRDSRGSSPGSHSGE